jgi:curved DNA-binding protein CbpA
MIPNGRMQESRFPTQGMEGQLSEHPLAELIREGINAKLSGALRLARERVKVAVYLAEGAVIFAASNLRAHRLSETLKHDPSLKNLDLGNLPTTHSDDQLSAALIERGLLTSEMLRGIRERQVTEVLRVALLWTNGTWAFDPRIRIADDLRTPVDVDRLLLECGRHLPASFVATRVNRTNGSFSRNSRDAGEAPLLPAEAFVLSRVEAPLTLTELTALGGVSVAETYGAIYALSLAGLLDRGNWPKALLFERAKSSQPKAGAERPAKSDNGTGEADENVELNAFFARIDDARDHYDVLDVGRLAETDEIKRAYHLLARRFHPDRFHQREAELRQHIEAAFARIAQAYETLSNGSLRAAYDGKLKSKSPATAAPKPPPIKLDQDTQVKPAPKVSKSASAESSFQRGLAAMQQNQRDLGLRLLSEASMLEPRVARYRAQYGYALIKEPSARRIAETELQAAISLEPNNASYRVMLAELYKQLGLRRRAEGELERALVADPKNETARTLLSSLKKN